MKAVGPMGQGTHWTMILTLAVCLAFMGCKGDGPKSAASSEEPAWKAIADAWEDGDPSPDFPP